MTKYIGVGSKLALEDRKFTFKNRKYTKAMKIALVYLQR